MSDRRNDNGGGFVIPALCTPQAVLVLTLISVLLALVLVLFSGGLFVFDWLELGRAALFILWNMLLSAALLCGLRERIAGWHVASGAIAAYALILAVCLLTNLSYQIAFRDVFGTEGIGVDGALLMRDLLIAAILGGAALRYFHLQGELLKRQRSELDARIQSLQARIRPHFLFNSMNIIASLIALDPDRAERAVEDLSELFRASLREGQALVTLAAELDVCDRYLRLEQLRIGDRLRLNRRVDVPVDGVQLPALCLQPLLENAVYHGIQPRPDGGEITLLARMDGRVLHIEVGNPLPEGTAPAHVGSGIALDNIRARLAALYGKGASLETRADAGRYLAVLRIPQPGGGA